MMLQNRLRYLRERNELTQKEIFTAIGCGDTSYRKYEHGEREVPIQILLKLAQLYDVSLEYLSGKSDQRSNFQQPFVQIHERLFSLRRSNHLSQDQVANLLHCQRTKYSQYENGNIAISLTMLLILCGYYHVTLDYICGCKI